MIIVVTFLVILVILIVFVTDNLFLLLCSAIGIMLVKAVCAHASEVLTS